MTGEAGSRVAIPESEYTLSYVRSPGPGGQNVNKVATAVELRFDVAQSQSLPAAVRERLVTLAGMTLLYGWMVVLQTRPQWLSAWRRLSYAGFYVDEFYTRLALTLWPARWIPPVAAGRTGDAEWLTPAQLADLEATLKLREEGNAEVVFAWLQIAVQHRYQPAVPTLERFLTTMGRRKFVLPLFTSLWAEGDWGRNIATPLYARARRGEAIEVAEREVEVEAIELLALAGDQLRLAVTCGSGTYIRSLARDLGEALGCGAHITALRRTWVEPFNPPAMFTFESLEAVAASGREGALEALLLPVEAGLAHWPAAVVGPDEARRLGQGQAVSGLKSLLQGADEAPVGGTSVPKPFTMNLLDESGRSLGLGEWREDGQLWPKRLFRWASAS